MYNNPLITIPRLQYSWEEEEAYQMELGAEQDRKRRQAKARRSHFRSSPAGDQSIGGLGETGYRGAPPSIFANPYSDEEAYQAQAGKEASMLQQSDRPGVEGISASKAAPHLNRTYESRMRGGHVGGKMGGTMDRTSLDPRYTSSGDYYRPAPPAPTQSSGAVIGATSNNVGGSSVLGNIWGGIKEKAGGIADAIVPDSLQGDDAPSTPSTAAPTMAQSDGDKVAQTFDATDLPAYDERAYDELAESGYVEPSTAAPTVATADTADVADQPWMTQSSIFRGGKVGDGTRFTDADIAQVDSIIDKYFGEDEEKLGPRDRWSITGNAQSLIADIDDLGGGDLAILDSSGQADRLRDAVDEFITGQNKSLFGGIFDAGNAYTARWGSQGTDDELNPETGISDRKAYESLTDLQKKEMVYQKIKGMIGPDSEIDIDEFMKKVAPQITEDELKQLKQTSTRIENEALGKKEQTAGVLSESVVQMGSNVRDTLAKMGQGTETSAEVNNLISSLSESVEVPNEYEVVRDSAGQPVVRFRGKPGKIEKDPETGLERQTYDMTQGRLDSAEEQILNDALQSREQGQAAVQQHIQAKLGLSIDEQRAKIVSAEFTESLNLEKDRFEFQKDQFQSNNALAEANVTGIFGDAPTLAAQDLMGRLTGRVQTGTQNVWDEYGQFTQSPIMADTVEMKKMRAELIGMFEGQPTINREQFDAAVKGYLADKSPTFAREQWEGEQARLRDEALLAAGEVVKSRYMTTDPITGRQHEVVVMMDTLEKKRQVMDEKLQQAQLNGLRSIVVPILDKNGDPIPGQNETLQVSAIEQMRTNLDQQRLDHMMRMEEMAQTGKIMETREGVDGFVTKEAETLAGRAQTTQEGQLAVQEAGMDLQERQFAAEQAARAGQAFQVDPTTGEFTGETVDALQSENVQNRMRAQGIADERAGLEQRGMPTDTPEGVRYQQDMEHMRRSYVGALNQGLNEASVENTGALESALNQALPPTPAGMVWDGQSGTFKLRAGYEGRTIDPATQREMEQMAPLLRARDRSERVLSKLQEHKFEFEQMQRMQDESDRRLREALGSADIETAEEEAYRKQVAERKLVEAQAKNEKYNMLFQLLQNPTALGMARRYGVLQQIEQDIGMQIPGVPEAGPADTIPTPEEWSSLNQEERAFRASLYASETGGSPEQFFEMIGRNAPAQMQTLQYGVL